MIHLQCVNALPNVIKLFKLTAKLTCNKHCMKKEQAIFVVGSQKRQQKGCVSQLEQHVVRVIPLSQATPSGDVIIGCHPDRCH